MMELPLESIQRAGVMEWRDVELTAAFIAVVDFLATFLQVFANYILTTARRDK